MEKLTPKNLHPSVAGWVVTLTEAVAKAGGKAFVVGGAVRDALRGEISKDVDLEVYGLEIETLERTIEKIAPFDTVGRSFGVYKLKHLPIDVSLPRRESKTSAGHKGFEVMGDPHMSYPEACARRDFTINAMMWDIRSGELIDPWGGLRDLENKILRHTSPHFVEDPLRVLRAMQFVARFELDVHPSTMLLCSEITPENLPAERLWEEWKKLVLKGQKPSLGLNFLKACGWVKYYPELAALIGCQQDPEWHPEGDAWQHTLCCMDAWAKQRNFNDKSNTVDDNKENNKNNEKEWETLVVGLGVLLHDIGKPPTTQLIEGRWRSRGHDVVGVPVGEKFLRRLTNENALIEQVLPLIECHMRPRELWENKASDSAIRRLARKVGRIDRLLEVVRADMAGRPPMPADAPECDWLQEQANRLQVIDSTPKPLVQGRNLIALGYTPGPEFKNILEACYEAQLEGEFATLEAGAEWLKKYLEKNNLR